MRQQYQKKEKSLTDKKQKLFEKQDITKFLCEKERLNSLERKSAEILQDAKRAFTFMLPEESDQLRLQREELNYLTNQCLSETQRVGLENRDLLIDHFLTMSKIQLAYYSQHHRQWADLMKSLSGPADNVEIKPLQ